MENGSEANSGVRAAESGVILEVRGLSLAFGAVRALRGVDFTLRSGEIHALMGENGAGKSTLIKCIGGVLRADAGAVQLDGREVRFALAREAEAAGIATVFQEVGLIPSMSIAENICLGREPVRTGWPRLVRWDRVRAAAREAMARLGHGDIDVTQQLGACPVAVQQLVSIARALAMQPRVLILDEPTSSLDREESQRLMRVIRELRSSGIGIVLITHFLEQAESAADRVTVLRDGNLIGTNQIAGLRRAQLVSEMVGRSVEQLAGGRSSVASEKSSAGELRVDARGIGRRGVLESVDLRLREGEVVGLAGLLGSGRTETARLLFGAEVIDRGELRVCEHAGPMDSPRSAIRAGLGLCPENRKSEGIVAELSVRENIALALLAKRGMLARLGKRGQTRLAEEYVRSLGIKAASVETPIGALSGGNQQKALLGRWLATGPRVLILDEPTRGIDIAAKADVLALVSKLAAEGAAVLIISSEIEELVDVCDRVVVLRDRRSVGMVGRDALTEQSLLAAMAGSDA